MDDPDVIWPGQDKQIQLANCRLRIDNLHMLLEGSTDDRRSKIKIQLAMYKNILDKLKSELHK